MKYGKVDMMHSSVIEAMRRCSREKRKRESNHCPTKDLLSGLYTGEFVRYRVRKFLKVCQFIEKQELSRFPPAPLFDKLR